MNRIEAFDENFFSFAAMLGSAPGGSLLRFAAPSLAAASGQPYAGENYAIFGIGAGNEDVTAALSFFSERRAEFVAPWLPQTPYGLAQIFEERGLLRRRIYTSMYLPAESMRGGEPPKDVSRITEGEARRWGEAAWYAFGGDNAADTDSYRGYGAYLAAHESNMAFALEAGGRYLSTALIHETENTVGLYYFATLPEHRRRGLALRLMDGLTAALAHKGKPLVLLATEAGLPFYIFYGFKVIDKVPICSLTVDF